MIKQLVTIFLSVLLLLASTGFTLHQHYCCGKLVETSLLHPPDFCCGDDADCCQNISTTFLLDEDFEFAFEFFAFSDQAIALFALEPVFLESYEIHPKRLNYIEVLHPPDTKRALAQLQVYIL